MSGLMYLDHPVEDLTSIQRVLSGRDLFYFASTRERWTHIRMTGRLNRSMSQNMWGKDEAANHDIGRIQLPKDEWPRGFKLIIDPYVQEGITLPTYGLTYDARTAGQRNYMDGYEQGRWILRAVKYLEDNPSTGNDELRMLAGKLLDSGDFPKAMAVLRESGVGKWVGDPHLLGKMPSVASWFRASIDPNARVLSWGEQGVGNHGLPMSEPPWWEEASKLIEKVNEYKTFHPGKEYVRTWSTKEESLSRLSSNNSHVVDRALAARFHRLVELFAVKEKYDAVIIPMVGVWAINPKAVRIGEWASFDDPDLSYRNRVASASERGIVSNEDVLIECNLKERDEDAALGEIQTLQKIARILKIKAEESGQPIQTRQRAAATVDAIDCIRAMFMSLSRLGRALGLRWGREFARIVQHYPAPGAAISGLLVPEEFKGWSAAETEIALRVWPTHPEGTPRLHKADEKLLILVKLVDTLNFWMVPSVHGMEGMHAYLTETKRMLADLSRSTAILWMPGYDSVYDQHLMLWAS